MYAKDRYEGEREREGGAKGRGAEKQKEKERETRHHGPQRRDPANAKEDLRGRVHILSLTLPQTTALRP
jgi:hypothetical protein